jgi:hypothetical protein
MVNHSPEAIARLLRLLPASGWEMAGGGRMPELTQAYAEQVRKLRRAREEAEEKYWSAGER